MAYPTYLREKARELRIKRKLSLLEIAERLALPKTTVFYWIRDLPDPEIKYRDSPARARARAKGSRREGRQAQAHARSRVSKRMGGVSGSSRLEPTFRDFVCMYIGEGYKRNRNVVSLANSDPRVIRLADSMDSPPVPEPVTYSVQYHADQRLDELCPLLGRDTWCRSERRSVYQRKSNSSGLQARTWRSTHGVLTVSCEDTNLRARLQAWMDRTQEQWLDSLDARGVAQPGQSACLWVGKAGGSNPPTPTDRPLSEGRHGRQ